MMLYSYDSTTIMRKGKCQSGPLLYRIILLNQVKDMDRKTHKRNKLNENIS